jgi:hypothetical protein
MFIINEDGIFLSLDFTRISENWIGKSWLYLTFFSDFNYAATFIIFFNLISLIIYFRFYRRNPEQPESNGRSEEINQVIQDIIRLNNLQMAIGGNLQNLQQIVNATGDTIQNLQNRLSNNRQVEANGQNLGTVNIQNVQDAQENLNSDNNLNENGIISDLNPNPHNINEDDIQIENEILYDPPLQNNYENQNTNEINHQSNS